GKESPVKTWIAAAAVAALALAVAPEAPAQVIVSRPWTSAPVVDGRVSSSPAYHWPYSYYAAWPGPARSYVPYGPGDQFPFYGQPYGHPYDRWSWSYMRGGYSRYVAR